MRRRLSVVTVLLKGAAVLATLMIFGGIEAAGKTAAPSSVVDSTAMPKAFRNESFHASRLVAPLTLMGVGYAGVRTPWLRKVEVDVKESMAELRNGHYIHIDDYIQYLPAVSYLGIGLIPCESRRGHSLLERSMAAATAYGLMAIVVNGVKYTVREQRPDCDTRNSFPSGHTATAFTGAELIRLEYGGWTGLAAYIVAFGTGFLRVYNERHWLNDVVAGAGVGIFCAQAAYWLLPIERRLFRMEDSAAKYAVVPYVDPYANTFGLSCSLRF